MPRRFWIYILIFVLSQVLGAVATLLTQSITLSLVVANGLAVVLFAMLPPKGFSWRTAFGGPGHGGWRLTGLFVATALPLIVVTNLVQENWLGFLPDLVGEANLEAIMGDAAGVACLCLLGPLAEELLFRAGVLGTGGGRQWQAVVLSAMIFALCHLNPAQMPAAFVLGMLLGWAYRATGSLVAPLAIHVMNNSLAVVLAQTFGNDATLTGLVGGPSGALLTASAGSILAFLGLRRIFFVHNKV